VHAYAALSGRYRSLTRWSAADDGDLLGEITLPLKVATVGGTLKSNPGAALGLAMTGANSAIELAELMAAVGLAQNFAALRALATSGIQAGHMKLHARSVAASAGTPDALFDEVVAKLIDSGEIKDWKAQEILADMRLPAAQAPELAAAASGKAAGKVILLGEHGVVYGRHALAVPISDVVNVSVTRWRISIDSQLPFGKGLGSSAAIAVAIVRAFNSALKLGLDDERVNAIAFASEKLAHGTPSGVDNTLATFAKPMLFRNAGGVQFESLDISTPPPLLVAWGQETGRTSEQVAGVRKRREQSVAHFDYLFDEMDRLSRQGAELLQAAKWEDLGALMNICHGLLNAIGVSTPDLERMVALARQYGAVGAKITGAGGGGSIVALCPGNSSTVDTGLRRAGYQTLVLTEKQAS
jgi:hydroxymethylglutaryl-CoA reductase